MIYHVGTSGWHYEHWQGRFYPAKLGRKKWLEYYAAQFSTVELNNSFYRLPSESAFTTWYKSSPQGFVFAVKASRFITHVKRLKNAGEAVEKFTSRTKDLKEKLGPLLYQLPPGMHRDDERLEQFLSTLPRDLKHAIEFRHASWLVPEVFDILRRHDTALCVFDMPDLVCPLVATAGFAYIRFHGGQQLYSSEYTDKEMADWAKKLAHLGEGLKEIYIYFNNDAEGLAVKNAMTLRSYLEKMG